MLWKFYAVALPLFLAVDALWLGIIARNLYKNAVGTLLRDSVNWWAAALFYLLFVVGLVVFVIAPAVEQKMVLNGILYGAQFGLIAYATYDLTNLATLKHWPVTLAIIDMAWGAAIGAIVSSGTTLIAIKWLS